MYNPSRGGVRGGADQFTWESVKSDKHRENYLGHSLKAPVGRWQKGKDLSWYAKERKDSDAQDAVQKSDIAAIKKAEEEAMLIALGHNIVKKETQSLTKEEMKEALKRNIGNRDDHYIERVDGLGSGNLVNRKAMLSGASSRLSNEGVSFELTRKKTDSNEDSQEKSDSRDKKRKKSKKHKHDKYSDSELSDSYTKSSKKKKKKKKYEHERQPSNSGSESDHYKRKKLKKHKRH